MKRRGIRNVAIVAHVDHGKTSLVDQLLRQSGQFAHGELQGDCILDSNPLERERGITILSKNCAIDYRSPSGESFHVNVVDTPGHADFSGEVERVLRMADGVLLVVDSVEGVMPQTRYVLSKALQAGLAPVVAINKMDRPDARPDVVHEQVFDLLVDLGAEDAALEFPTVLCSAREGWAVPEGTDPPRDGKGDVHALFQAIVTHVPAPDFDECADLQAGIMSLDFSEYVGRIGVGRVFAGTLRQGEEIAVVNREGAVRKGKVGQLFRFRGLGREEVDAVEAGDLFAAVGLKEVFIGDTLCHAENVRPLPPVPLDEPTMRMTFRVNDSPFAGREGKFVTSRQLQQRLMRELQSNVALRVEERDDDFMLSGRGLLHLSILIETMRREGYEFAVGRPEVIFHDVDGERQEPIERLVVDVPTEKVGPVMELVGERRGETLTMDATSSGRTIMEFDIPTRGLIGLRSRLLTATQGELIMNHRVDRYGPVRGEVPGRINGVLVATDDGAVTGYALLQLASRGTMFVRPGDPVYMGQIVGETPKDADIDVNVVKLKKLSNVRSSTKEATELIKAPKDLSLEAALEYVADDELVELTPESIRMRKRHRSKEERRRVWKLEKV